MSQSQRLNLISKVFTATGLKEAAPESWIIEITMYHLPLAGMEYLLITMNDGQSVKKTSIKIRHATLSVGYIIINSCSRHNVFLHTTDS